MSHDHRCPIQTGRRSRFAWIIVLLLTGLVGGCADPRTGSGSAAPSPAPVKWEWQVGTIVDVRSRRSMATAEWLKALSGADVIYLGEEHHNDEHIKAALRVLESLVSHGRRPVLGLEMFSWDGQSALDRQLSDNAVSVPAFLDEAKWTQNWGGSYEDYEPLVLFAKQQRLRLRALNAPRPLVRKVAREGLARTIESAEAVGWGMRPDEIVDDGPYRNTIIGQLKACHGGGEDRDYQMMYEASLFRDEAMAKTLADEYRTLSARGVHADGPIVSYTGGGHIQYRLPIPQRVARRLGGEVKQVTVYLASFEAGRTEELQEWITHDIADYIWLTPVGVHGPPSRCR